MINAYYYFDKEQAYLCIKGHSGYGKEGEDIVCAGVSSLAMALNKFIQDKDYETFHISGQKGSSDFYVKMNERTSHEVKTAFRVVIKGIEAISEQYPENVAIQPLLGMPRGAL